MHARLPTWVARLGRAGEAGIAGSLGVAAALCALVAWSLWLRWRMLDASPFPLGVDGYYYPIQLRALLERGELAYPASPLTFYLLAPLAAATDPITGAKLGAALLGAVIAVPAYGVGARLGGGRGAGLVAAALATTSVGSAYLTVEFVKNGIGLTVALAALWLVLAAAERPTRLRIAAAFAGLAAAWTTHKMAAGLVAVVAIPTALAATTTHGRLRGRRLLYAIAALALAAAAAIAIAAANPRRFLSPDDAALLRGLISSTPRWTAPALALPSGDLAMGHDALLGAVLALAAAVARIVARRRARSPRRADRRDGSQGPDGPAAPADPSVTSGGRDASPPHAPEAHSAPAVPSAVPGGRNARSPQDAPKAPSAPAVPSAAPGGRNARSPQDAPEVHSAPADPGDPRGRRDAVSPPVAAASWAILALALAIGLPLLAVTDRQGLGFRLRIAAFVPAALSAAILARATLAALPRCARGIVLAAVAIALVAIRRPPAQLDGEVVTHPALVSAALALGGRVPPGATLIVPERHIAFLVAWYTGAPVALRPERIPPAERYRLMPLHFIRGGSALDRELLAARAEPSLIPPLGVHPGHPNGLVLVAEPTWAWIVARLPADERARADAWPIL